MNALEMLEEGKRYAIGDGVMVDYKRAYSYWKDVADLISTEDEELFCCVKEYGGDESESSEYNFITARTDFTPTVNYLSFDIELNLKKKTAPSKRIGKALAYLMYQFKINTIVFMAELEAERIDVGFEKTISSIQGISQALNDKNGVEDGNKYLIVCVLNRRNERTHILRKPLTVKDLYKNMDELSELFISPRPLQSVSENTR